jgi:hypothetical protein
LHPDQIKAVHQTECENLIQHQSHILLPRRANYDHFKMPFIVSDESLHMAGAGLNEFDLISIQKSTFSERDNLIVEEFACNQVFVLMTAHLIP